MYTDTGDTPYIRGCVINIGGQHRPEIYNLSGFFVEKTSKKIMTRAYDDTHASELVSGGISPVMARIYAARGVTSQDELSSALTGLLHFSELAHIDIMANKLADAVIHRRSIVVVADYDADGATACAVAIRGLGLFGLTARFFVPNRFIHGYGLTPEVVEIVAEMKPDMILTVDNGVASVDGVTTARAHGIEVLITDHHLPGDTLPDAVIVNPNQDGCSFKSKHLAGVGVIFYVLLAVRATLDSRGYFNGMPKPNMGQLLDLVALGTYADVVSLDGNNRILVEQGLQRIRTGRACPGIVALFSVAGISASDATATDLGFMVGPRLNAAGRIDDMSLGIQCLLTDDADVADGLAKQLQALNTERRAIESGMQEQALATMPDIDDIAGNTVVLFNPDWHAGVVGILASRIKDRCYRPTICFSEGNDGEIRGSGRSIPGLHLRDALDRVYKQRSGLIIRFGGHSTAAGLTILRDRLQEFTELFELSVKAMLAVDALEEITYTDGEVSPRMVGVDLASAIRNQVWGQGFPPPLFSGRWRVVQQRILKEKHSKLKLASGNYNFDAILFNDTTVMPEFITATYQLDLNTFKEKTSLQLQLREWVPA